jgi:hypothetical protein
LAVEADIPDDAQVIGIVCDGRARAYSLAAMSLMTKHIVNDVIDTSPITVTYCDRLDCVRVFEGEANSGKPLAVNLMGYREGLLLQVGGQIYEQESGRSLTSGNGAVIPLAAHPYQRTTWKEWKAVHPTTDIFTGKGVEPRTSPPGRD